MAEVVDTAVAEVVAAVLNNAVEVAAEVDEKAAGEFGVAAEA